MSLPEGKAIYLIAFSPPLVLYTQTHRPACHPHSFCLLMLIFHVGFWFFQIFIHTFVLSLKNMSNLNFYFMEKYYLCSIQSKVNPNQNETVLVSVDEVSAFVSSNLRPDCILIISQCSTFKAISDEK